MPAWIMLQSKKKLMGQSKEIKQKYKWPKSYDACFSVMFSYYGQSFISGRETGRWALPLANIEIYLIFLRFLRSQVLRPWTTYGATRI